ncbi:MAG: hypothetical protein GF419_14555 [Ignavibacteriales bacterium]|nr:hypothetical protein [Ignavibacteriales bacterium]
MKRNDEGVANAASRKDERGTPTTPDQFVTSTNADTPRPTRTIDDELAEGLRELAREAMRNAQPDPNDFLKMVRAMTMLEKLETGKSEPTSDDEAFERALERARELLG